MLSPIKLEPPGEREVVDREKAEDFVKLWTEQLLDHRAKVQAAAATSGDDCSDGNGNDVILCDRIRLSDKSYTAEAALLIASFLKEPFEGSSLPLAHGIVEADLTDIIASRMTDEGLFVLQTICDAFADSKLVELNLSENAIGEQAIQKCRTAINKKSLERLYLCNNGLAGESMERVADILTNDEDGDGCIAGNLTTLHFYNNMSGAEG